MKAYYNFPTLPPSQRLKYENLSYDNLNYVFTIFANDPNPHIEKHFKDWKKLQEYADYSMNVMSCSNEKAGLDWVIFEKNKGFPIGMLYLFDLSTDTTNNQHKRCSIGIAIAKNQRRKYFASEAVMHLIKYIFDNFSIDTVQTYTSKSNVATDSLFEVLGFVKTNANSNCDKKYKYYEITKSTFTSK